MKVIFCDLAIIINVTAEQNRSNLSICGRGTSDFSENSTHFCYSLIHVSSYLASVFSLSKMGKFAWIY